MQRAVAQRGAAAPRTGPLAATRRTRHAVTCSAAAPLATLSVTLRRPLGIVFAERGAAGASAGVFVEELVRGGNAEKAGVRVGDVLARVSATVLKDGKEGQFEKEGYGQRPYTNWDRACPREGTVAPRLCTTSRHADGRTSRRQAR